MADTPGEPTLPSTTDSARLANGWLVVSGVFSVVAILSALALTIAHLRHYRRPASGSYGMDAANAQRFVVRIIWMVPVYAVTSWISLDSIKAAFYVDALRDIYEAFVVYCFFSLLVIYLGGERELLFKLHTRLPVEYIWPVRLWVREMDAGDPYTFLFIKRGILQFVYVKPALSFLTMMLKLFDLFDEANMSWTNGYLWITIVYNVTFSWCLYCLSMFFVATRHDLEPFRAVPKFLCIKAIIFFSYWQSVALSLLVSVGLITDYDNLTVGNISVAIQDFLICIEMVPAAIGHWYAFSYTDFITPGIAGRLPMFYALRDALGYGDIWYDTVDTLEGTRFNYRTFEPADGVAASWQKRINTGLRYSQGGRGKYWLVNEHNDLASSSATAIAGSSRQHSRDDGSADYSSSWDAASGDGMLGFQACTWDVDAERDYAEARDMLYGDVNSPVLEVTTYIPPSQLEQGTVARAAESETKRLLSPSRQPRRTKAARTDRLHGAHPTDSGPSLLAIDEDPANVWR